jgi:hypothetical protein
MRCSAIAVQDTARPASIVKKLAGLSHLTLRVRCAAANMHHRGDSPMMILLMILLVVLPYGTALICGAITYGAGKTVSGWCSVGGLALGIYFFHLSMSFLTAS